MQLFKVDCQNYDTSINDSLNESLPEVEISQERCPTPCSKARFIRRISAVSNLIQFSAAEMRLLIHT